MTNSRSDIYIVDDHPIVASGFQLVIDAQPDLRVCGVASSANEAITRLQRDSPDLIITDLSMPGRGGLELIKDVLALRPRSRILVVSMHDESLYATRALRAGAKGYLMKDAPTTVLLSAIRTILNGGNYVSNRMTAKIVDLFTGSVQLGTECPLDLLTDRELDVFRLFGEGMSTREIAVSLRLSPKTIAVHRDHIRAKLGFNSGSELLRHALRWVESQNASAISHEWLDSQRQGAQVPA